MPKVERPPASMMPDGDEKDSDVRMWSPDTDRSEMRLDRKSTIEELQDKLHFALTELDETKGALDLAQKRVSELESNANAPEPRSVDVRIEIAKSTLAFLLVLAAEITYFVVILQEKAAFGDKDCTGVKMVARRSCEFCGSGTLVMPVGGDYEKNWSDLARTIFYLFVLLWSFQGVGIICDEFMAAIEKISSRRSKWITNRAGQKVKIRLTIWNGTLANLSLMALGSSAPEILLSTVELCSQRFFAGSLGPQTVVGSASFNLFCISSVCISAIPHMDVRKIQKFQVFIFTCSASVLAYLWMLVVLSGITPNRVDIWEGVVTLLFFFVFLGMAFSLDKFFSSRDDPDVVEVHRQLEARFGQPVSLEGVRAMLTKPTISHDTRNSRISAKGQLRRLSTGAKKQTDFVYGFVDPEVVLCHQRTENTVTTATTVTLRVEAANGAHPSPVRIKYRTRNGMAKAGERYHQKSGVLHFLPDDDKQELTIGLLDLHGPPEEFYVELTEIQAEGVEGKKNPPLLGATTCCLVWLVSDSIPDDCNSDVNDEFKTTLVMDGGTESDKARQHLQAVPSEAEAPMSSQAISKVRSEKSIRSDAKTDARSEARSDAKSEAFEGDEDFSCEHWRDKVIEAFYCNGSPEEQAEATAFDWLMHCLALTWKIIFLIVPPPSLLSAYPSFFCSLFGIGLVTVVINDAASLLGCSVGLADDLTAITLVALGTSLPDTLASRTAAMADDTADNSIGNITGSNTVNVLLGMGISWTLGSIYWATQGVTDEWRNYQTAQGSYEQLYLKDNPEGGFIVVGGAISFSVTAFSVLAMLCVALLFTRRQIYGGELGGPKPAQRRDSMICLFLWVLFLVANIVYDQVK